MTQLYIAGVEVVISKEFSTAVKRENSFFTKNGEYTYDVTVNLDNPINKALWPQWRLNNSAAELTKRTAVLIADNRVYCNGTEVITGWTNNTVTIQIVSGNSELNYFIGQDLEIKWLTGMGEVDANTIMSATVKPDGINEGVYTGVVYPDIDYCLPTIYNETKEATYNLYMLHFAQLRSESQSNDDLRVQPYLLSTIKKILHALGYTITTNQLDNTSYKYLFTTNYVNTRKYCEMFPGWTVKSFFEQVENLLNVVFVVDNTEKTCGIYVKTSYYVNTPQRTIKDVIDEYEVEVEDETTDEHSASNIMYTTPDTSFYKIGKLSDTAKAALKTKSYPGMTVLYFASKSIDEKAKLLMKDSTTGRTYIRSSNNPGYRSGIEEADQWRSLIRDTTTDSGLEIKIVPAPYGIAKINSAEEDTLGAYCEVNIISAPDTTDSSDESDTVDEGTENLNDYITGLSDSSTTSSECQLYLAFYNGWHTYALGKMPNSYTDTYHAMTIGNFTVPDAASLGLSDNFEGSLRLEDIDKELYDGVYIIDTKHGVTIESYDPNKYDVRNIFIIGNKRYVCSSIEETIVAKGRQKKWKGTFYPITLSDTAANSRWVLNDGNWDDGGVWIDDGKWID